jgi:hypothetical protein
MSTPSVPPVEEVQLGRYEYQPIPMDEPPMPSNLFIHYFNKNTTAHNEAIWSTRFPIKLQESLFYTRKPLTEGWGIEITEGPNWLIFCTVMVIVLVLSGVIAIIYVQFTGDKPTGVAIGAWLTAVQAMAAAAGFFKWTSK